MNNTKSILLVASLLTIVFLSLKTCSTNPELERLKIRLQDERLKHEMSIDSTKGVIVQYAASIQAKELKIDSLQNLKSKTSESLTKELSRVDSIPIESFGDSVSSEYVVVGHPRYRSLIASEIKSIAYYKNWQISEVQLIEKDSIIGLKDLQILAMTENELRYLDIISGQDSLAGDYELEIKDLKRKSRNQKLLIIGAAVVTGILIIR